MYCCSNVLDNCTEQYQQEYEYQNIIQYSIVSIVCTIYPAVVGKASHNFDRANKTSKYEEIDLQYGYRVSLCLTVY